jgi:hypothetical protein
MSEALGLGMPTPTMGPPPRVGLLLLPVLDANGLELELVPPNAVVPDPVVSDVENPDPEVVLLDPASVPEAEPEASELEPSVEVDVVPAVTPDPESDGPNASEPDAEDPKADVDEPKAVELEPKADDPDVPAPGVPIKEFPVAPATGVPTFVGPLSPVSGCPKKPSSGTLACPR